MVIRCADPECDAAGCAAVYAGYVVDDPTSFEEEPPDAAEMARRILAAHAWLVADDGGGMVGFAYATPHRPRAAYRWAVETSVYVVRGRQGEGLGRALYAAMLPELSERGFRTALAVIALPNAASVALHESFGFQAAGVLRRMGWKAGAWRDVGLWQLALGDSAWGGGEPPAEPYGRTS
jgi:phosphinothricin acetyltransferase